MVWTVAYTLQSSSNIAKSDPENHRFLTGFCSLAKNRNDGMHGISAVKIAKKLRLQGV